jgi:hypothetical protein
MLSDHQDALHPCLWWALTGHYYFYRPLLSLQFGDYARITYNLLCLKVIKEVLGHGDCLEHPALAAASGGVGWLMRPLNQSAAAESNITRALSCKPLRVSRNHQHV